MNCQSFELVLGDLAREEMMEVTVREEALLHRASCDACASKLHEQQKLTMDLRQVASMTRTLQTPGRVEDHLLAEFRNLKLARGTSRPSAGIRYRVLAAVAAVLLLAVGVVVIRGLISRPELPQRELAVGPATPAPTKVDESPLPVPTKPTVSPKTANKLSKRAAVAKSARGKNAAQGVDMEAVSASNRPREIATEFLPIGYAPAMTAQDGAQLVRVEMPRSAMARFGLPVNMDRYDERVKADVLFSADGMARAIRFVQ